MITLPIRTSTGRAAKWKPKAVIPSSSFRAPTCKMDSFQSSLIGSKNSQKAEYFPRKTDTNIFFPLNLKHFFRLKSNIPHAELKLHLPQLLPLEVPMPEVKSRPVSRIHL
jgi:hypothetical protein